MSIKEDITQSFKEGSLLTKLIYINLGVFVLVNLLLVGFRLFDGPTEWMNYLLLPSYLPSLVRVPWTILSYMFLHTGFIHLIFNVLTLYWFGTIFSQFFSQKDLVGIYLLGGLMGGLTYIVAFNLLPCYAEQVYYSRLLGASASIMAIVLATAVYAPEYKLRLVLIGQVKLEWIALAMVLVSLLQVTSTNAGGEWAHIGGAFAGFFFAYFYKKGTNIVGWINSIISFFVNLFQGKYFHNESHHRFKVYRSESAKDKSQKSQKDAQWRTQDMEYNARKKEDADQIDKILEKIKKSGYDSLTEEERRRLFGKK